jgi:CheY-like chemotaxis protein
VGHGTTITLRFPVGATRPAAELPGLTEPPSRVLRVLLVEDEAAARDSMQMLVAADGHTVTPVGNGVDALMELGTRRFDVVLTDRAMPEMGGDELAARIKASPSPLPVVMVTGFGVLMASAGELPAGVDLLLSKPVTRSALRSALATVTQSSGDAIAAAAFVPDQLRTRRVED